MNYEQIKDLSPYELGETGSIEALSHLEKYLQYGKPNEVRLAASAVSKIASRQQDESLRSLPILFHALNNSEKQVRQYILNALGKFILPYKLRSADLLTRIANQDEKEYNRKAASKLLIPLKVIQLSRELAKVLCDYRQNDGFHMSKEHVLKWVCQFPHRDQPILLRELIYTYKRTYISSNKVKKFIESLITKPELTGTDIEQFWRSVQILSIQKGGSSQQDLNTLLADVLNCKLGLNGKGIKSSKQYIYLDDAIYSGNRVHRDFETWLESHAGLGGVVYVILYAVHSSGHRYAKNKISEYQKRYNTSFTFKWLSEINIENEFKHLSYNDVLRPTALPTDPKVEAYAKGLAHQGFPVRLRHKSIPPHQSKFFSSESGRHELEQILCSSGIRVLSQCPNFPSYIRPYGFDFLKTLGFGSLIAFYRNCPNNSPVSIWAGDPWIPLLPRKTN